MFQPREDFSDSLGGGESRPRFLSNIWGQVTCKMSVKSSHFQDKLGRVNNLSGRKRFNQDKLFITKHLSGKRRVFPDKIGEAYHSNESAVGQP